jgi:hypothetical protein
MNKSLGEFQDAFAAALFQRPAEQLQQLIEQPGFAIYRNTVLKGCVDALGANYPCVASLVGDDWLRAAAAIYAQQSPPSDCRLLYYGADFAEFLEQFEPARDLPYLADVARLDRLWLEAFAAPQEACLELTRLGAVSPAQLAECVLQPRSSVRWRWFSEQPIYSIWRHNREEQPLPPELPWHGEGALLVGHRTGVRWQALDKGGCIFLDACAAGHTLDQASALALQAQPDLDFTTLLGQLLSAEVFRPLNLA